MSTAHQDAAIPNSLPEKRPRLQGSSAPGPLAPPGPQGQQPLLSGVVDKTVIGQLESGIAAQRGLVAKCER